MDWVESYPEELSGEKFKIRLGFRKIHVWLANDVNPRIVKVSEIQNVTALPDGSTKIIVRFHKDIIVPTSSAETEKVVQGLIALLNSP